MSDITEHLWRILNKEYGRITENFREGIEQTVKDILKEQSGVSIRFKELVCAQYITDNVYADCRGIQLGDDGSLTFQMELHQNGQVDDYENTLEEMDLSSYYEIILALNEKQFVVEKTL